MLHANYPGNLSLRRTRKTHSEALENKIPNKLVTEEKELGFLWSSVTIIYFAPCNSAFMIASTAVKGGPLCGSRQKVPRGGYCVLFF